MTKFLRIRLLSVIAVVLACFFTAGCFFDMQGKSAYQIAVEYGFVGTEEEWLESLKGRDGLNGADGQNAVDIDIYALFDIYQTEHPGATLGEFLEQYLTVESIPNDTAAKRGLRSVVSVVSAFSKNVSSGWGGSSTTQDYSAAGAGVIYRISGSAAYITTNYHVVYDSDSISKTSTNIKVYFYGQEYDKYSVAAEYIGGSPTKDVAVLRIDSPVLSSGAFLAADFADSNTILPGNYAVAIGNPAAEGISVTAGIVSVDSEMINMQSLTNANETIVMRVLRLDAAVNGGNSGGGLFNQNGKLIGIVNAKTSDTSIENIAYAIPSNVVRGIADIVIDNIGSGGAAGKFTLGITTTIFVAYAEYDPVLDAAVIREVIAVESVSAGSAASGKFIAGDKPVSVRLNGGEEFMLTRNFHLSDFLYKVRAGGTLVFKVLRGASTVDITVAAKASDMNPV